MVCGGAGEHFYLLCLEHGTLNELSGCWYLASTCIPVAGELFHSCKVDLVVIQQQQHNDSTTFLAMSVVEGGCPGSSTCGAQQVAKQVQSSLADGQWTLISLCCVVLAQQPVPWRCILAWLISSVCACGSDHRCQTCFIVSCVSPLWCRPCAAYMTWGRCMVTSGVNIFASNTDDNWQVS